MIFPLLSIKPILYNYLDNSKAFDSVSPNKQSINISSGLALVKSSSN